MGGWLPTPGRPENALNTGPLAACPSDSPQSQRPPIDLKRYRKVRNFFLKVFWQILFWDVLLAYPGLRAFRPSSLPRWRTVARKYKEMAVEMGGVLIKLGQFLSIRVDILPPEITFELAGLQDEVPPESVSKITAQIEEDFCKPISEIFNYFSDMPLGAASLAQAHVAGLHSGEEVVVKVLRPGIHRLVETDLSVLKLVCRWLKMFKHIRTRMNVDLLMEEFQATTRRELDLLAEMKNIKRFAADFSEDEGVAVPGVFEDYCAGRALTLENVFYIRIGDISEMDACGIDRRQVADRLYDIYMKQIFSSNFVHVDPHPGNLFVRPLPVPREMEEGTVAFAPGDPVPHEANRPFQIVFIDFGMTAIIPERVKVSMRMFAIGVGTRDAQKMIQAYSVAGVLQPGADLRRLEQAHEDWFQRIWGLRMGKFHEIAFKEASYFFREYRDLIADTPFQFQADALFISRTIGILAGITTRLDPQFDPWQKTVPYAKRFAREELKAEWHGVAEEAFLLGHQLLKIPAQVEQVLHRANVGSLSVQVSLSLDTRRAIRRIDLSVKRFSWMVLTAGLFVSAINLHIAGKDKPLCYILIGLSVITFLWGIRKG